MSAIIGAAFIALTRLDDRSRMEIASPNGSVLRAICSAPINDVFGHVQKSEGSKLCISS